MKYLILMLFFPLSFLFSQAHNWNSPSEVVKKVKKKYAGVQTLSANFTINTTQNKKNATLTGACKFKSPGKIKYEFTSPDGDAIVSDGKTLWIYIKKIGAVGKQDLEIEKENSSGDPIFVPNSNTGLNRLFRKYHYKFNSINQPQKSDDGKKYFVLALEQREKIGGFEHMTLYIDAETYLIHKAVGKDSRGKETTLEYSKIVLNSEMEDGEFNYHISGNAKIVNNPLVSNNQ
ncbi:MAG: outer membrane lipoprotein carrier protein LolA [Leptospiraceae bacterium]|nr:outer membrane lipoprotein carrier protein LolA [Leptospiraceae bacterium]MCP5511727.1 outer membrane lipoprotein carrier protein LolA [Leptospiraceae bacterium]